MKSKKSLYVVPVASTGFIEHAWFDPRVRPHALRFEYSIDGVAHRGGIEFRMVAAWRARAERCCTAWHIEGAYDTLVEIDQSEWVAEVSADTAEPWRSKWEMHHYMIYLGGACHEFIADSWAPLPPAHVQQA